MWCALINLTFYYYLGLPNKMGVLTEDDERVLEQEPAIHVVLSADRKVTHLLLSRQDLDVLKAINSLAKFTSHCLH